MATQILAMSSGWPQRRMGVRPSAMSLSYLSGDDTGHIGGDDAGANFVDVDDVVGEPVREQLGHHAHARPSRRNIPRG